MTKKPTTRKPAPKPTGSSSGSREKRLASIVTAYLDRLNADDDPDVESILRENSDLTDDLKESFSLLCEVRLALEPDTPGRILEDYRLLRRLGGGMSVVYEAIQISLNRKVALKLLPGSLLKNSHAIARFLREAEVASRLEHPGICPVYEAGVKDATPYMTMRFLEGQTLAERNSATGQSGHVSTPTTAPLKWSAVREEENDDQRDEAVPSPAEIQSLLRIIEGAARALHAAHETGLVHRDVKPSNIMVTKYGLPVVLDFGLALEMERDLKRLTHTGELLGTPPYMSPEQISGKKILLDHRTDVYSLGVTLYECLTQRLPFDAPTLEGLYHKILDSEPQRPRRLNRHISKDLEAILEVTLQKNPDRRYQTALEFADDLMRLREHKPLVARRSGPIVKSVRWARRKPVLAASFLALFLLMLSTGILVQKHRAEMHAESLRRYRDGVREAVMLFHLGSPSRTGHRVAAIDAQSSDHAGLLPQAHAAERALDRVRPTDPMKRVAERLVELTRNSPRRPEAYYHLARALLRLDRAKEALAMVDKALLQDSNFVPGRTLRGTIIEKTGQAVGSEASSAGEGATAPTATGSSSWARAWLAAHRAGARRHWEDAVKAYTTLIDFEPGGEERYFGLSMEIRLGRARACLELGDLDGALEDLAAAQALWPRALVPGLLLGEVYHLKGYRQRAEKKFQRLLANSAFPQDAIRGIVETYHELEDYEKGHSWAKRLEDEYTRELKMADMLRHLDRLNEALDAARRAVALSPESADAHNILGIIQKQQGNIDLAIQTYQKAVGLGPDDSALRANLGNAFLMKGLQEEAVREYREALRLDPMDVRARHNLAMALSDEGNEDEAVAEFHRLLEFAPRETESHAMLADTLQKAGRPEDALVHLRIAIGMDPDRASYHDLLASALKKQGELEGAIEEYRKAIALDSENHAYHEHLGSALDKQGKVKEALAEYDKASKLAPDCVRAVHGKGVVLATHGRPEEAIAAFQAALELDPEFADAQSSLGNVLTEVGRQEEGLAALQRAAEMDPTSASVHSNLGTALVALGKPDEAIAVFRKAVTLDENDAVAVYNLGVALEETGQQEEALARFEKALAARSAAPGPDGPR